MKVFVAGATGETGRRIVTELIERNIPVRALVRNLEIARSILPSKAELVVGDVLDRASLAAAIGDATVLISATGAKPSFDPLGPYRVDYEGTKNLVDVAQEKGIQQFVMVSSLCVSRLLHPLNLFFLILLWKKQGEEYLQHSGLSYTIVRPGGLKNEDVVMPIVMSGADTLFEGSIPRSLVAKTCVAALTLPSARNKVVEIIASDTAPAQPLDVLFANAR